MEALKKYRISVSEKYFRDTYTDDWERFDIQKRERIRAALINDIGEALQENKEIKNLPEEIKIIEVDEGNSEI